MSAERSVSKPFANLTGRSPTSTPAIRPVTPISIVSPAGRSSPAMLRDAPATATESESAENTPLLSSLKPARAAASPSPASSPDISRSRFTPAAVRLKSTRPSNRLRIESPQTVVSSAGSVLPEKHPRSLTGSTWSSRSVKSRSPPPGSPSTPVTPEIFSDPASVRTERCRHRSLPSSRRTSARTAREGIPADCAEPDAYPEWWNETGVLWLQVVL